MFWVPDGYDPDHFMPWVGKCESFYETDQNNIEWCAQIVHAENTEPSIQNQHPEYLEDLFSRSAVNLDETEAGIVNKIQIWYNIKSIQGVQYQ